MSDVGTDIFDFTQEPHMHTFIRRIEIDTGCH